MCVVCVLERRSTPCDSPGYTFMLLKNTIHQKMKCVNGTLAYYFKMYDVLCGQATISPWLSSHALWCNTEESDSCLLVFVCVCVCVCVCVMCFAHLCDVSAWCGHAHVLVLRACEAATCRVIHMIIAGSFAPVFHRGPEGICGTVGWEVNRRALVPCSRSPTLQPPPTANGEEHGCNSSGVVNAFDQAASQSCTKLFKCIFILWYSESVRINYDIMRIHPKRIIVFLSLDELGWSTHRLIKQKFPRHG